MALVDASILTRGQASRGGLLGDAYDLRKKMRGDMADASALSENDRQMKARQVFNESAVGKDFTTEEGLKSILSDMVRKGYAQEAQTIFEKAAPLYQKKQAPTPAKDDVIQIAGSRPFIIKDGKAQFVEDAPIVPGKPDAQAKEPDVIRVPGQVPYQVVGGEYRPVKGAPIVPKDVKEPKPIEPPKPLSGDASKLASIAYTLPQDVEGMKAAFTKDFKGSIASLSAGTNPNLEKLKSQIADKLGRLRSGGAVNVDEEARFDALISKVKDLAFTDVNDAISTLDDIAYEAQIIMEGIDRDGSFREQLKSKGLERKPSAREPAPRKFKIISVEGQ